MPLRNLRTEMGRRDRMRLSSELDFLLGVRGRNITSEAKIATKIVLLIPVAAALYTCGRARAVQSWKLCVVSVCYRTLLKNAPSKGADPTTLRCCSSAYLRERCSSEPTLRRFATRLALEHFLGAGNGAAVVVGSLLLLCPCAGHRTKLGVGSCP